jgi:hypothetical protein
MTPIGGNKFNLRHNSQPQPTGQRNTIFYALFIISSFRNCFRRYGENPARELEPELAFVLENMNVSVRLTVGLRRNKF